MSEHAEYRGAPLHSAEGWVALYRESLDGPWMPLFTELADSREAAIERYDEKWGPGGFEFDAAEEMAACVRARLVPDPSSDPREG